MKKKLWKLILLLVLIFIIGIVLTIFAVFNSRLLDYYEIDASVIVIDSGVGLNTNTSILTFGKVGLGGAGIRRVSLTSPQDSTVILWVKGDISKFLTIPENNFKLSANVTKNMEVYVEIPEDAKLGHYTGKVKVYFFKN